MTSPRSAHWAIDAGRAYLTDHGIHEFSIAKKYELGIVIEPLPGDERFTGMLSIPYLTKHGCRAIRFRNLNGGKPKMAQPEGQKLRLYNSNAYFDADDVIGLAEGEVDAITSTEKLGTPTIGLPGAESWK